MKNRKTLIGCFAASLLFHVFTLFFFQRYSLWFSSSAAQRENCGDWLSLIDKKERDQILKESFSPSSAEKTNEIKPQAQKEELFLLFSSPQKELPELSWAFQSAPSPSIQLIKKSIVPSFNFPEISSINLLDHLPKEFILPLPKKRESFSPFPAQSKLDLRSETPKNLFDPFTETSHSSQKLKTDLSGSFERPKQPNLIPLPKLPTLPTLSELNTASYSDSFDTDLVFLPKEGGKGYIFAITLIPKPDLNLPRLRQHFTFLIDRANSIQQDRLLATKSALHRCMQSLLPEDTFNIIAFDNKIQKLSPNPLPCIGSSFAMAEEFLEKIHLGSFFSSSDLYKPLLLTVPSKVADDELHTAILLTDGESLAKESNKLLLYDWTHYNQGHVCLFALGINDPQTAILEAVTAFNRGKYLNLNSKRALKRKLLKLLKTIQNPIAKNLVCRAMSRSSQSNIKLYPEKNQMPCLYLDQPYVILGETDVLDDFILFIQGKLKNRWLNIRKTVSFVNARKGNKSLRQEYALQKAYTSE